MSRRAIWLVSTVIWGLFAFALVSPAFEDFVTVSGFEAFMRGWRWPGTVPEMANLALVAGWVFFLRGRSVMALVCAVIGFMLASTAPFMAHFRFPYLFTHWVREGYWMWLASIGTLLVASAFGVLHHRSRAETGCVVLS